MSLQKQLVHINITGSLERKDDSALVIPSKLTRADDVVFDDASSVIVRGGQATLNLASIGAWAAGGFFTPTSAKRMFTHRGVAHIEHSKGVAKVSKGGGTAPVINEGSPSSFVQPWNFTRAGATTQRIAGVDPKGTAYGSGNPYYDGNYDCASSGDWTCYVIESRDTSGSGRQSFKLVLQNDVTGFRTYDTTIRDGSYVLVKPRVIAIGSTFYIYYAAYTSGLQEYLIRAFTLTTGGTLSGTNSVATALGTDGTTGASTNGHVLFDVATDGVNIGIVALSYVPAGPTHRINFYQVDPTDGYSVIDSNDRDPAERPTSLTALYAENSLNEHVIHAFYGTATTTTTLKAANYNFDAAVGVVDTVVGTGAASSSVGRVVARASSSTELQIAYDSITAIGSTQSSVLRASTCSHSYTGLQEVASVAPWFIAGRFVLYESRIYLPMLFYSGFNQSTVYLIDFSAILLNLNVAGSVGATYHVVARIDYGECAYNIYRWFKHNRVPNTPLRGSTALLPYIKYETDLRLVGTTNETSYALACASIDFDSQLSSVEANGLSILAGACPLVYDGNSLVEEGFHHAPEIVGGTTPAASGTIQFPATPDATYTICCTLSWQDAQGNWHESAPSNEVSVTTSGANDYVTPLVILPPTQKPNTRLIWYRTQGSSTNTTLYVTQLADGTNITLDTALAAGEALYTTGDVLPNAPMPACRHLSLFQNRVVASGVGDGSRVVYSKQYEPGYCVEFTDDNSHQTLVPASAGRVVGSEEADDRLFILCENAVGIIYGQGPSATGLAGAYSSFNTIVTETGALWSSPKSIIRAPEGVWFRSPFGIRLVSRQGTLARGQDGKQVGAEVDSLVSGTCVAVAGDAKQQVRFYQSAGTVLVWDYQWLKWTRFTGHANVDAAYADGRFYHIANVATVPLLRYYDEAAYRDVNDAGTADSIFEAFIETAWLQFAGIQGFQRLYRLMLLGKNTTANAVYLRERFYYDFSETEDAADQPEGAFTPGAGNIVQVQHHMVKQKCESMKIQIRMRAGPGVTPGRFRLTDLTLQVGVKPGYYKLPSSQRF